MDFSAFTDKQAECVRLLDGPLLVCAGAGSGKTYTLTQRIAWSLLPGSGADGKPFLQSIDQALIITFTSKAACELKDRIRSNLRAEKMIDEALKVDGAWISTIHGMCERILREHALELGLDPEFQLVMGSDQTEVVIQAINTVMHRIEADPENRYQALFDNYRTDEIATMLQDVLSEASSLTDGLDAFTLGPEPLSAHAMARQMIEALESAQDVFSAKNAEKGSTALDALAEFTADAQAGYEELSDILGGVKLRAQNGRQPVADAIALIKQCAHEAYLAGMRPLAQDLLDLAGEVDTEYCELLHQAGLMDTGGLIRTTLKAFRADMQMAATYSQKFKLIMVDEFQDTSQLQIDMIECIAGSAKQHLCTVGDSQQSIYRFQGADVTVYLRHKAEMKSAEVGASTVLLEKNFRSHGDILAFVRKVCGVKGYFGEDFLDLQHGRDEQKLIDEGRAYKGSDPRIEAVLATFPKGGTSQARLAEAARIAQRFGQLRDAGHSADQMVVLLGVMTNADVYAEALREQGFACVIAGGSGYFATPEVRLCQCLLQVLANPMDSQNLLPVLASEVLPVSSDDLLLLSTVEGNDGTPIRQNTGIPFYAADCAPQRRSPLLDHALSVFSRAYAKLGFVRPSRIFLETVADTGWLQHLQQGGAQGQAQAANVLKFARLIEDAEQTVGFDMTQVSAHMATAFSDKGEKPGALSVKGRDAVRIMTVHASKGLEFPIVAVAECFDIRASQPGGSSTGGTCMMVVDDGTEYLSLGLPSKKGMAVPAPEHPSKNVADASSQLEYRSLLMQMDFDREYAERRRLFYVAITRASEALIVSMHRQLDREAQLVQADLLRALCPGQQDFPTESGTIDYGGTEPMTFTRIAVEQPAEEDEPAEPDEVAEPLTFDIPDLPAQTRVRYVPLSEGSDFFSYSSLAPEHSHGPVPAMPAVYSEEVDGLAAPVRPSADQDKATVFGSALHRACEWLALQPADRMPDDATVDAMLDRIATSYGISNRQRLTDAFGRWASSDICARALSHTAHQPEVPFCAGVGAEYLDGEIDLLCYDNAAPGGSAFIVDYKTGGSDDEPADALLAKHLLQAQCYAFAVLGSGFSAVELHFVRIERDDPSRPGQPQVVDYAFESTDIDTLKIAISHARAAKSAD